MNKKKDNFVEIKGLIDVEALAASLANSGDLEQALFFNIFFKALRVNCGDEYRTLMQLTYIHALLGDEAKARLLELGATV